MIRQKKGEWFAQLTGQGSVNAQMFSTGDFDVGDNYKLHGSVQCPRDLSSLDCMKCPMIQLGLVQNVVTWVLECRSLVRLVT